MNKPNVILLLAALLVSHLAAATEEQTERTASEGEPGTTIAAPAETAEAGVSERLRHKERATGILDVPLDGSSVEAFESGLEKVRSEASPEDYNRLSQALKWHQFYNLAAKSDKEKLYRLLDGKTPRQIMDTAGNR
ncbi:MAG: hypothetical protein GWM87_00380 [Xanthomonadales bacterium]|nr:hypothetical protein [Xanthomonadales bacterium]NIX11564.1 hypothetical protein [Xanthomonadales bacterium]